MTVKEARVSLRRALMGLRRRIRFPGLRLKRKRSVSWKDILFSEDLVSIGKEFAQQKLQRTLEGQ